MADLKVRSDGWSLARLISAAGIDLADLPPGEDGWHSFASMTDALAAIKARNERARREAADAPRMSVQEAYDSGRIHPASRAEWQQRYDADPDGVGRVLASLSPVVAASDRATPGQVWDRSGGSAVNADAAAPSSTPKLDALTEALYGPDVAERQRREDLAAERELSELELSERQRAAASALTADEMRALFGAEDR